MRQTKALMCDTLLSSDTRPHIPVERPYYNQLYSSSVFTVLIVPRSLMLKYNITIILYYELGLDYYWSSNKAY